jgi:hypothetical protein
MRFHQFDPIAEWIVNIYAMKPLKGFVIAERYAKYFQAFDECGQILNYQRWMRFTRRAKIRLDAEMNLEITALEPAASTFCQSNRLWDFRNTQGFTVELASAILSARWHSQLHVVQVSDSHGPDSNDRSGGNRLGKPSRLVPTGRWTAGCYFWCRTIRTR